MVPPAHGRRALFAERSAGLRFVGRAGVALPARARGLALGALAADLLALLLPLALQVEPVLRGASAEQEADEDPDDQDPGDEDEVTAGHVLLRRRLGDLRG